MNSRNVKAVLLLSVVLPLGLLVGFEICGIMGGEAKISEAKILPVVSWELERPCGCLDLDLGNKAERLFADDEIRLELDATPRKYDEDDDWAEGADVLGQRILVNISVSNGFLRNLNIVCSGSAQLVRVSFPSSYGYDQARRTGLRIDSSASNTDNWWLLPNNVKAFINMTGLGRPRTVFFEDHLDCYLSGSQNQTHEMQIVLEITYFNGTLYKRFVQPFSFRISRDNNDSFERAQEITTGYLYERLYIGNYDGSDYYTIQAGRDQKITVHAWATPFSPSSACPLFYVLIYDPQGNCRGCSPFNYDVTFNVTTDRAGSWYVEVRNCTGTFGFYSTRVDLQ